MRRSRYASRVESRGIEFVPDYSHESRCLTNGARIVAGIDEVGRGPLAGPVVAAAVILERKSIPSGLDDSKKLTEPKREYFFDLIMRCAFVGIGMASVEEIDRVNIRRATHLAMMRALGALNVKPDLALIDGNDAPALPCASETLIGGDGISVSIAAASIVAKVTRDRMMRRLHVEHPGYGWDTNKGYGTQAHLAALKRFGVTGHHRKSFAPVYQMLCPVNPGDSILTA